MVCVSFGNYPYCRFFQFPQNRAAGAGPALVAQAVAKATSSSTATTPAINTTGANLLVIVAADYAKNSATDSITDSLGNIWAPLNNYVNGVNNITIWYAKNPNVGPNHTFSGRGSYISILVSAWSGMDTVAPFDVQNGAGCAGCHTLSPGSITPSADNSLIITGIANAANPVSIDSNFVLVNTQYVNSSKTAAQAYLVQSTAAAVNPTWTQAPSNSPPAAAIIASFKAAASVPDTISPSTPVNLAATAVSTSQIDLSWTPSTDNVGVTGYQIFRDGIQVSTSSIASFSDAGLAPSTTYTYAVTAFDTVGNISAQSAAASATTQAPVVDTTPPSVPANLAATAVSTSQINLSWSASTDNIGVTGYQVFRNGSQVATTTITSFSDTNLALATSYSYAVSAFDAAGNVSAQSATATAATLDGSASPVLIIYRNNTPDTDGDGVGDSEQLARYYASKRNIPIDHLLGLNISVASTFYGAGQYSQFYNDMVLPTKTKLGQLGTTSVDVLLLAGSLPSSFYDGSNKLLSVDNALMGLNILGSASSTEVLKELNPYFEFNPSFGTDRGHFDHAAYKYVGTEMYLVTRLGSV